MTENTNSGCSQRDSAEHEGYAKASRSFNRIWKERDSAQPKLLEAILYKDNLNRAYKRVKANKGAAGIDEMSIEETLPYLKEHQQELKNRILRGKYTPSPVRRVEIPKPDGGVRKLGIPTVIDRTIQEAITQRLVPIYEPLFADDSYGYRPGKSAKDAILKVKEYAEQGYTYAVSLDLSKYFDTLNHEILINLLRKTVKDERVVQLIKRYLKSGVMENGVVMETEEGSPQGGVISPVLANLFLHYVFDDFMTKAYPNIWWERYADDGVLHCQSYKQAVFIKQKLEERFQQFGLELNKEKTRIVYCKDNRRSQNYSCTQFTFLGYTFRPRLNKNKEGKFFVGFTPAVSEKAKTAMKQKIREWKIQLKADLSLKDIGNMINKVVQGWINYYTHYYKSEFYVVLRYINQCLIKWVRRSYKKKNTRSRAEHWLGAVARRDRNLFAHWKFGILPSVGDGAV